MKFKYQARNKQGEMQVGFVEANGRDMAAQILSGHDLFVLSVEEAARPNIFDRISSFFARVKRKDMIVFSRQIATLLEAQLPLNNALTVLSQQTVNLTLKDAILQAKEDIDAGLSFSQALEKQSNIFPDYYIEMVRAAEVTGNLGEVTSFLADYTQREGELASKAASAMIYPAIVLGLFVIVAFILITFVYPSLGSVFAQNNVTLPWYTQILLNTGNFLNKWWLVVVVGAIVLGFILFDYVVTDEGKAIIDEMKIRLPLLKKVYLPLVMARFGNSAALLVRGGVPIAQSLEIISHMVGNTLYQDIIHDVADDVRKGVLLSESLSKYPNYFPALVAQMVAVGETTGKTEEMFTRLSGIYTREAGELTNNLIDLIQPLLIIGMGIMVGLLFASILIPIYSLTSNIH